MNEDRDMPFVVEMTTSRFGGNDKATLAVGERGMVPFDNGDQRPLGMVGWEAAILQTSPRSFIYLSKKACRDLAIALMQASIRMDD